MKHQNIDISLSNLLLLIVFFVHSKCNFADPCSMISMILKHKIKISHIGKPDFFLHRVAKNGVRNSGEVAIFAATRWQRHSLGQQWFAVEPSVNSSSFCPSATHRDKIWRWINLGFNSKPLLPSFMSLPTRCYNGHFSPSWQNSARNNYPLYPSSRRI